MHVFSFCVTFAQLSYNAKDINNNVPVLYVYACPLKLSIYSTVAIVYMLLLLPHGLYSLLDLFNKLIYLLIKGRVDKATVLTSEHVHKQLIKFRKLTKVASW